MVDKGWLTGVLDLTTAAVGAVARLNTRIVAGDEFDRCVRAIYETGRTPADCPPR